MKVPLSHRHRCRPRPGSPVDHGSPGDWIEMRKTFLAGAVRHIASSALLVLFLVPGMASAEERSWFEWFFNRSAAVADEGPADVTASHVFRATKDLLAEIEVLRDELGVAGYPVEPEFLEDRAPVHAYAKSLEVMQKVARVQSRYGLTPVEVGLIPPKEIVPADVLRSVNDLVNEVRRIKTQMVIEFEIEPAELVPGKTSRMVYKNLAEASFLLDGLRGWPLTPEDVYVHVMAVLDEMEIIAAKLEVPLQLDPPIMNTGKKSIDIARQVLYATYKVINLQTRLGMDASAAPTLTLVRVTPSEVYDATNMLMAEMNRIKAHLGIALPREPRPDPGSKGPDDVFAQVMLIIQNLDAMVEAASA